MIYFGFSFSAGMLPSGTMKIMKSDVTIKTVLEILAHNEVMVCANPSHAKTFQLLEEKYSITLLRPEKPINITLDRGDALIVAQLQGIDRLTDSHQYSDESLAKATVRFILIEIL
jgi:hypothetical protein